MSSYSNDTAKDRDQRLASSAQDALRFHAQGRPGQMEIVPTKPIATQRDLSLAYSPGVAAPVRAIAADPACAFDYTAKGNLVAILTNGSAILGLGNLGALAAKPVMEGKAALFKRFADIDAIDLEISSEDPETIVDCVKLLAGSWGGINLADIKAPDCFVIERKLKEALDIPILHDDQHGAAIIVAAGLLNALALTGRRVEANWVSSAFCIITIWPPESMMAMATCQLFLLASASAAAMIFLASASVTGGP